LPVEEKRKKKKLKGRNSIHNSIKSRWVYPKGNKAPAFSRWKPAVRSQSFERSQPSIIMKTAVWYTSTFFVIFVYLYVYLVQYIRGAEIRPPPSRRIGVDWTALKGGTLPPPIFRDTPFTPAHPPPAGVPAPAPLDFSYHNYEQMTDWLKQFTASYSNLTALYSIGKSVQGIHKQLTNDCTHYSPLAML